MNYLSIILRSWRPGRLMTWRCCPQIAKATCHRASSAPEESRLIESYQQLNIPKWQHLISSFCPGASLALSLPLSLVSPSHFSEHHYLIISQHTNLQTNTQWHEWINLLKCAHSFLLWIISWHVCPPSPLGPPGHLLLPQLHNKHQPRSPISLLLVRPFNIPPLTAASIISH